MRNHGGTGILPAVCNRPVQVETLVSAVACSA